MCSAATRVTATVNVTASAGAATATSRQYIKKKKRKSSPEEDPRKHAERDGQNLSREELRESREEPARDSTCDFAESTQNDGEFGVGALRRSR